MTAPTQANNPAAFFAATVGRYFTVVSVVPSLLLVAFIIIMVKSGAWGHEPDFGEGIRALTQLGLGGTFALILGALALGVVLHPLQFALVQLLEGYWGVSAFSSALRENRIRYHLRRLYELDAHGKRSSQPADNWDPVIRRAVRAEARRLRSVYPDVMDVMPTRLGNALRAAERNIGSAVGLDIVDFAPHLIVVAPRAHADYVNDQRTALDLATRTCLVCLLAFLAAVLYLWPHRLWLLVALIPLGLAWLCYQGAVSAAQDYGAALRTLFDLNRFTLYERMGFAFPPTTTAERATVEALKALSSQPDDEAVIRYRQSPQPPAT